MADIVGILSFTPHPMSSIILGNVGRWPPVLVIETARSAMDKDETDTNINRRRFVSAAAIASGVVLAGGSNQANASSTFQKIKDAVAPDAQTDPAGSSSKSVAAKSKSNRYLV